VTMIFDVALTTNPLAACEFLNRLAGAVVFRTHANTRVGSSLGRAGEAARYYER
jgi:hypothetical protein